MQAITDVTGERALASSITLYNIGSLFENLVIVEAMKAMTHYGRRPNLHFYRDNHKQEINILFKRSARLIGIEIKSSVLNRCAS